MGHVHLKVAAIPETVAFYRDVLGFGLMAQLGPQAAFLSARAATTTTSARTPGRAPGRRPPPGTAALRHATIVLPDEAERERVLGRVGVDGPEIVDPSGNALLVEVR